jgi:hypothetical protein
VNTIVNVMRRYRNWVVGACVGFCLFAVFYRAYHYIEFSWSFFNRPEITCDEPTLNFGEHGRQDVIEHTFIMRNQGRGALHISQIRAGCSCVVPEHTEKAIPPEASLRVPVKVNLAGRRGKFKTQVVVASNDPVRPYLVLEILGTITSQINVNPERLELGTIVQVARVTRTIEIDSSGKKSTFNIEKVWTDSPFLETQLETVQAGKAFRVRIGTTGSLPTGIWHAHLFIRTDIENEPNVVVPVSARIVSLPLFLVGRF